MLNRRLVLGLVAALFALTALGGAPQAAAGPATVAAEELGLTFENTCTPDTFRPNEWVVVECDSRLANEGEDPLVNTMARIGSPRGVTPDYFWMWYTLNGEFTPISGSALSIGREGGVLEPGQSAESRLVVLLRMPGDGTYESDLTLSVGQQDVLTQPIRYTATAEAAAPPAGLEVAHWLMSEQVDGDGVASATYGTIVVNRGSSAVTELKVTNRYSDPAVLVEAEPAPASEKAAFDLATWDLASFGKESLAPGESFVLATTYGHASEGGCGYVTSGVVVEAVVDGQRQLYGARPDPDQWAMVGDCQDAGRPGGGDGGASVGDGQGGGEGIPGGGDGGPPVAAPATGEGMAPQGGYAGWAMAFLAAGGASLVGAAQVMRRRSRR
jgi:hypothetical protein